VNLFERLRRFLITVQVYLKKILIYVSNIGWTDFFIGNVIERPGRADNFKDSVTSLAKYFDHNKFMMIPLIPSSKYP
jgi:hypothetical protein